MAGSTKKELKSQFESKESELGDKKLFVNSMARDI